MKPRDLIDGQIDVERRVGVLERRRNDGEVIYARNAEHPDPIAEWLSIPSNVPRDEFSVGRTAAALWEWEREQTDPMFHTTMRLFREGSGAVPWLGSMCMLMPDTHLPDGIFRGSGIAAYGGSAAGTPRLALAPLSDQWVQRIVIPGAPRFGATNSGAVSIGFFSGPGIYVGHSGMNDMDPGWKPGEMLYRSVSMQFASPRWLNVPDALVGGHDHRFYFGLDTANGDVPARSGWGRGPATTQEAVTAVVPGHGSTPLIVGATPAEMFSHDENNGFPESMKVQAIPYRPGTGAPPVVTGEATDAGGVGGNPGIAPQPIMTWDGVLVGYYYIEEDMPGAAQTMNLPNGMVLSWGPPIRRAEVGNPDVNEMLDPGASVLKVPSGFDWSEYQQGAGAYMTLTGVPTSPAFDDPPAFADVADGWRAVGLPPSYAGDIEALIDAVEASAPAYEHRWEPLRNSSDVYYDDVFVLKRHGFVHLRGSAIGNIGVNLHPDYAPVGLPSFRVQSSIGPLQVQMYPGNTLATTTTVPADAVWFLDGITYPSADA